MYFRVTKDLQAQRVWKDSKVIVDLLEEKVQRVLEAILEKRCVLKCESINI